LRLGAEPRDQHPAARRPRAAGARLGRQGHDPPVHVERVVLAEDRGALADLVAPEWRGARRRGSARAKVSRRRPTPARSRRPQPPQRPGQAAREASEPRDALVAHEPPKTSSPPSPDSATVTWLRASRETRNVGSWRRVGDGSS